MDIVPRDQYGMKKRKKIAIVNRDDLDLRKEIDLRPFDTLCEISKGPLINESYPIPVLLANKLGYKDHIPMKMNFRMIKEGCCCSNYSAYLVLEGGDNNGHFIWDNENMLTIKKIVRHCKKLTSLCKILIDKETMKYWLIH